MDRWGVHGRGMALFSVRSNVDSAKVTSSDAHKGTALAVTVDTTKLKERADQSTWPALERTDAGTLRATRGPHNIARRVVEFALEHPGVDVYLGTPTEVLTTLCATARDVLDSADLLFADDASRLAVWQRPAAASDADDLTRTASVLGIAVSERTAHRILAGELGELDPVLALVSAGEETASEPAAPDIYRDRRGLRIHHSDLTEFRRELSAAFDSLAEKYYIHLAGEPKITVGRDDIRVRFSVEKED
jgi:hypothetical protein